MGQLLREYRRVYPNDTRSDLSILELYRDQLGEEKFRQYKEDYDSYINEVNKLVPLGIGEEFSRGFTRGYEGLKGTAKGAAALALGKLIPGDQEETEDRLLASARENFQKASRPELSSTGQGALQGYAAGAGEVLPSLLEAGVTGAAGAIAGAAIVPAPDPADAVTVPAGFLTGLFSKSAVKNAIKENITLRLGKEATKEGVEKKYKDIVKEETTEALESAARSLNITDAAFAAEKRKIVSQTLGVGVTALNSIGLSSGEIYNQLRSDPDIDRDTAMNYALAGGVAAGVAEAAMPAMILTKAVRSVGSTKIRPYDVDGVYSKIVNSFPGKLAKNLGGSMAVEGGTEAYQSWVSIVTQKAAKGMTLEEAIDAPLSYEEEKEIAHAFKLGLIAGSLGGGVSLGIDALTGNEAIEYIDQIERTEEDQARAEIPLSMAKLTNEEMKKLDELALKFAVSMEVRQETEEGESIIIGIQRAAVDSELYNEEIKPLLDSSPTRAKYFSNRMVDLRAKIKLAIKENEERIEAARVEAEKQRADSGLPQMTVEQKFEALNNALAATQEERDARADLEARAGGIDPVVVRGVADTELETDQAIRSSYERIEPGDSEEVEGKIAELAKLNEEFSFMIRLKRLGGEQREKLISKWRRESKRLIEDIDKGRADQRKAEAKREADKKKAEAAEEKRKKKEEELTVKPKTVEENNNQLKLNVGNRSAQRADELALIGASIDERTAKAAKRAFEGINTDTKKVEEVPDEVISAAVEEAYNDKDSTLIPQKDEDGNDLPIPEVKELTRQEVIDVLEEYSKFTQVAEKKADYDSKADLLEKKKTQAAKIEEVLKQIDAGEVSGLPEDLIAFQTQPGDERRVEFDNLGNPKDPEDQSMSYPAYYEAEGNLIASDRFRIAVQAAYEAIEKSGDSVADVKMLGELLKSETFDKAPEGSEGKTTMLTRMVVLKDTRDDAPKDAKYQIVTITKSGAKQNYRVGIPVGVIKKKKNTVNIGLDEAMRIGFEPVASIRMTVPVDGLIYTMSEQEFKSMSQRLNQRRVHEADRAVIDDTAAAKSVENVSKDAGAATQAQEREQGGGAPDEIAEQTAQEEKTFTEEGEEVSLEQQIADAEKELDEATEALQAALDKMNLGVERLDLLKEQITKSNAKGLPEIDVSFRDFIDRYVRDNADLPAEELFHKLFMDELGVDYIGSNPAADLAQKAIQEYIIATQDAGVEISLQEAATLVYGLASNEINESIQNVQQENKDTEQADNKQGQATDDGAPQSTVDVARESAEAQQVAQAEGEPNVTEVEDDGTVHHKQISLETIDIAGEAAIEHLVNMSKEENENERVQEYVYKAKVVGKAFYYNDDTSTAPIYLVKRAGAEFLVTSQVGPAGKQWYTIEDPSEVLNTNGPDEAEFVAFDTRKNLLEQIDKHYEPLDATMRKARGEEESAPPSLGGPIKLSQKLETEYANSLERKGTRSPKEIVHDTILKEYGGGERYGELWLTYLSAREFRARENKIRAGDEIVINGFLEENNEEVTGSLKERQELAESKLEELENSAIYKAIEEGERLNVSESVVVDIWNSGAHDEQTGKDRLEIFNTLMEAEGYEGDALNNYDRREGATLSELLDKGRAATDTLNREAEAGGTSDSILNDKRLGETPNDVIKFFEDQTEGSVVKALNLLSELDNQNKGDLEDFARFFAGGVVKEGPALFERETAILNAVTELLVQSPVLAEGSPSPSGLPDTTPGKPRLVIKRKQNLRKGQKQMGAVGSWDRQTGELTVYVGHHQTVRQLRHTVVHEAFHALFANEISQFEKGEKSIQEVYQLNEILKTYREFFKAKNNLSIDWSDKNDVKKHLAADKIPYALTSLHEFVSEVVSNADIQFLLAGEGRGGTSVLKAAGLEFSTEESRALGGLWQQVVSSLRNLALKILDQLGLNNKGLKVDGITDTDLGTALEVIIVGAAKIKKADPFGEDTDGVFVGGTGMRRDDREAGVYFRQTNLMNPVPDISTDIEVNSTKSAQRNVAAQNLVKDTFRGLYEEYNKLGLNIGELSYEDFVKRNLGVSTTPEIVIQNLNAALVANGMAAVDPDYSVDDVTEKETVRAHVYKYLKTIEDRLNRKASEALMESAKLRETAQKNAENFESLRTRYEEITTLTKAVEREIRNNLKKARKDGVELTDIQRSVREELAPKAYKDASGKRVKPVGRTGEILQAVGKRMEALGINFSDISVSSDDLVTTLLNDRTIASSIQSVFPDNFQKQEEAARIIVELGKSNRYLFDYAAIVSDSALAPERGTVNKILAEAVKPDSKAMERARAMLSELTRSSGKAGHLLNYVQSARNKHTVSNEQLQIALDKIEVRDSIGPNLSDRLSLMEETLGVEWRVEALVGDEEGGDQKRIDTLFVAVEGAEYRVPSSPEQSSSSLYKSDPVVFTSTPRTSDLIEEDLRTPEKYRAKLKADLYKIHAWLNYEGRIKDAGYNYMKRVYDQLSSQVTVGDYLDGQAGFVSKLIGTLKDEIEATGSPIMQSLVRRLTRYVADSERVRNLEALSDSWAVAENEAISIFYPKGEMRDKESFRVNVYETALSFFENNQQILEENDSVEEAIEAAFVKLEAHLRKGHGDVSKTLQSNPQAFPALKRLLQATGDMSEAIMQQQEEMGIKVKDGTYFRKAVGAKLFTVSRSLSPKILATVINMRRDGWTKKFENIAQRYTEALGDPAKMEELKAEISSKFKSDTVVANFLRPIMDIPGLTQFQSAGGAIAEDSNANMQYSLVAESNDVAEAYKMSGSETDIIAFAENLYQLTGGDPSNEESRAAYVEDVLAKLDNLFSGLNRAADEHYNPESAKGDFGTGIGRPMMDARSSSGYPSEWLEYSTYEEQSVHITIRALAANAAFGERLRGFKRDIEASELAFKEQINRLQELTSDGLSEDEIRDILNKEYGPGGYNAVRKARKNLEMVDKVNKNITSLIANDAKIYDFRTFYEVLGTFSGLVVQNIKTGLIDLSSLFAMPFTNYGFTRKGFQQFFKGFNIFKEPIGSLLQIFGTQIDMDAGLQAAYTRVMVGDPDAQRDLTTRIKAAWARDVPGLDPVTPGPTRYIAKAARALQEVIGTGIRGAGSQTSQVRYATFKPLAPFTMIGQWMVATNTKNMWSTMTKLAQEGADYMRSNPDSARNPNFTFSHKNFKGMSEEAFNYMVEALNDSGMSLETLSERILLEEAAGSRPQIFTDSELRLLAIKAQEDVTKETSPLTRPSWVFTSALGRASNPLVGWSVEKFADVARKFKTKDELGNVSKAAMVRSLLPYMGVLPVSLAFTFMRKEWEEEVVGKRPNILEFDYENHGLYNGVFLPALDQTNRAGTFGIAGDLVNSTLNKSTAREFNVENRVFFLSMLKGLVRTSHTLAVQGSDGLDYNNTYRPLIQTLGGSGYLETSQILTRMFGISTPETVTTKRLNVENWLRVVGRPMVNQGVVVKKPSGLVSQPNKIKPHISNMRHAAISNDSQWFMQETNAAIQAYMKLNPLDSREDAEKKIKSMYSDYHPMRRVFTRLPDEEQYEEIINSVPEEHREEIRSALDLYNSFGETIGVTPFRGKAERGSGGSGRRSSATSSREAILRRLIGGRSSSYYGGNRGNAATSRNDILRKALGY